MCFVSTLNDVQRYIILPFLPRESLDKKRLSVIFKSSRFTS